MNEADTRFLQYWLMSGPVVREIDRMSTGARMPRANVNAVLDFDVPLPPLPEQKRIVAIPDELKTNSTGLAFVSRRKLDLSADLKQSILHKAFAGELTAGEPDRVLAEAGA